MQSKLIHNFGAYLKTVIELHRKLDFSGTHKSSHFLSKIARTHALRFPSSRSDRFIAFFSRELGVLEEFSAQVTLSARWFHIVCQHIRHRQKHRFVETGWNKTTSSRSISLRPSRRKSRNREIQTRASRTLVFSGPSFVLRSSEAAMGTIIKKDCDKKSLSLIRQFRNVRYFNHNHGRLRGVPSNMVVIPLVVMRPLRDDVDDRFVRNIGRGFSMGIFSLRLIIPI